jgi:lipopolysaccharide export system protein LptA
MRRLLALLVVPWCVALSGCGESGGKGGSGGSGPVGTWTLDTATVLKDAKAQAEAEMLKRIDLLPEDQREAARQEMAQQVSMLSGAMTVHEGTLTLKADHTFDVAMVKAGKPGDTVAGTWSQTGDTITLVHTTKNGKPATGNDAEEDLVLTHAGDVLVSSGPMPGLKFTFRRKSP